MRPQAGLRKPKDTVLGCDLAGRVEAVGDNVTRLRPGDEVVGSPFMRGFGAFAECARVSEDLLELKPANLSFGQAAGGRPCRVCGIRDGSSRARGCSLSVPREAWGRSRPTFAVQIAKSFDVEVTGTCSTRNTDMVRSIGADHVIDYTQADFIQGGQRYDLIFQLAGTVSPSGCRRALTSNGTLVLSSGESDGRWLGPWIVCQSRCVVTVRAPDPAQLHGEAKQGGPAPPEGAHRGGQCDAGNRQDLLTGRGPGRDPVPGGRTPSRKGRHHV